MSDGPTIFVEVTCPDCSAMFQTRVLIYAELTVIECPACGETSEYDLRVWKARTMGISTTGIHSGGIMNHIVGHRDWKMNKLTVFMKKDDGPEQADADIAAIRDNSSVIVRREVSENYFHQLRLRVAQEPSLKESISVFYEGEQGGNLTPVDVSEEGETKWPIGFCLKGWEIEDKIQLARRKCQNKTT